MGHHILVGITSGIAAYKVVDLLSILTSEGHSVEVIMTDHAQRMIAKAFVEKAIHRPIHHELYPATFDYETIVRNKKVDHIAVADAASVMLIAPATANTVAKLANGIADDYLTTTALAVTKPIILCPSMNVNMWFNPATQENIATLRRRGYIIIDPEEGPLACGYDGKGRMAPIESIHTTLLEVINRGKRLQGKRVIITGGGTHEAIDSVRFLTNRSTGKMAAALAEACWHAGADVRYLHSEGAKLPRFEMAVNSFTTADDLEALLKQYGGQAEYVFHAAAVSDFTPEQQNGKITSDHEHVIKLHPREKILNKLKQWYPNAYVVGFKAIDSPDGTVMRDEGKQKLEASGVDAILVNDISRPDHGFGSDTNEYVLVRRETAPVDIPFGFKTEVAERILNALLKDSA